MGRVTVEKSFELHMGRDGVSTICLGVLHGFMFNMHWHRMRRVSYNFSLAM